MKKYQDLMLDRIDVMKKNGYSEKDIANFFGLSIVDLSHHKSQRLRDNRVVLASMAKELKEEGKKTSEIADRMNLNESSVRLLLDEEVNEKIE